MKRFYRTLIVISCVAVLACDDEDTGDTQSDAGDTGTETGDTGGFRDADVTPDSVGDPTPDTTEDVVPDFVPDTADVSEDVVPDLPTEDLADGDVSDEEVGEPVNHGDDELDPTGGFWSESYIVSGALGDIGATVYASMLDENGHLIIGGEFEQVGAAPAANVARWDGETWTAMGDGLTIIVRDLVQGGTDVIYAAGAPGGCIGICGAGGIGIGGGSNTVKLWNDEAATWVDEGPALDGQIYALAMVDGDLWVGGSFAAAEDTNPANLAILSGGLYSAVSEDAIEGEIRDIELGPDGDVCIGGFIQSVGELTGNSIVACWDGESWSQVGDAFESGIADLHYNGTDLYAGGTFGGGVVVLSEGEWEVVDGGVAGGSVTEVRALLTNSEGRLYVGGTFDGGGSGLDAVAATNVAFHDGDEWNELDGGVYNTIGFSFAPGIYTFTEGDEGIYAGGLFSVAGELGVLNIAHWNETEVEWEAVFDVSKQALGSAGQVLAFAQDADGVLYAGGDFGSMGAAPALNVARLEGGVWLEMGDGLPAAVLTLEVDADGSVWAGGWFAEAGILGANFLAQYKGETWIPAVGQPSAPVNDISACTDRRIAITGDFEAIDDDDSSTSAPKLAVYDFEAETWTIPTLPEGWSIYGSAVLCGPDGTIYTFGEVVPGEGEDAVRYVLAWDDEGWSQMGGGMTDFQTINDIDMYGDDLYVAGAIPTIGEASIGGVAHWDGEAWEALGAGLHTEFEFSAANVVEIDIKSNGMFAIGYFSRSGETVVNHVAWWDGQDWLPMGDGLNDVGETVIVLDESAYVGGFFSQTGGLPALGIGQWVYRD